MANYTKSVDPNHLVTIGYEGYWGEYDQRVQYNPGNGWAGITGQNFSVNMAHDEIDFAGIHFWPDSWFANQQDISTDEQAFLNSWVLQHAQVATDLGKPLLMEEFGKAVNVSSSSVFLILPLLLQLFPVPCCFCCVRHSALTPAAVSSTLLLMLQWLLQYHCTVQCITVCWTALNAEHG